jgi:hypothetical protein
MKIIFLVSAKCLILLLTSVGQPIEERQYFFSCINECLSSEIMELRSDGFYYISYKSDYVWSKSIKGTKTGNWFCSNDSIFLVKTSSRKRRSVSEQRRIYIKRELNGIDFLVGSNYTDKWPYLSKEIDSVFFASNEYHWLRHAKFSNQEAAEKRIKRTKIEVFSRFLFDSREQKDIFITYYR